MRSHCLGDFDSCERRRMRLSGQKVPANLLPDGCQMEDRIKELEQHLTSPDDTSKVQTIF